MPITLGMLAGSGTKTRLEYQTYRFDSVARTTYTYSGISFGAAESGRLIVVQASVDSGTINSITIGGITATTVRSVLVGTATIGLFAATVPTGTSGTVVINGANTPGSAGIIVWSLYGVNPTAKASGAKANSTSYPALTLASGDIVICGDWDGTSVSYTNATLNAAYVDNGAEVTGASYRATSSETRTISNTSGGTAYSNYAVWGR